MQHHNMPMTGGGSMRRFLSKKLEADSEDPASYNSVKTHLGNIALGNPLTDEDHGVLPSRSMKISLSAECIDRNEKQVRNAFYSALHSVHEQASLSNISVEVSDSYIGSRSWVPRYHEGHLLSLRRCHRETHKADSACYFYIMWLSDYGELELPSRISCQLLDSVRQNLPSMLDQENRLFQLLLAPYVTDSQHSNCVRLLSPHEFMSTYQEYEQVIHNAWWAMMAFAFHASVPVIGDHPLVRLRQLMKSRLHLEFDDIQAADSECIHTKIIYRVFSEDEEIERQKKLQNEQRHFNDAKRPPYHETKEHVEELTDKEVCRFFFEGIPYGIVKKNVRVECTQRYDALLQETIVKYGSQAIAISATDDQSLKTLQETFQADFQRYVTIIIHSLSSIAAENVYRGMSLHWKENNRLLHNRINFACRKDILNDLTDAIIKQILNPTNEVQNNLSLKILISGPSGSGKSTFLAAAANMLSKTFGKRSLISVRYIKMDPRCKTTVGLLQSISAQLALLVPGSSLHAQMTAKQHLDELSASILRFCTPALNSIHEEEKIRFVLLIDDIDMLDADAVELLDSWIPVGFHPHFSIIATTVLDFMDEKLSFLRNSGLKRDHTITIPPFDADLRSALIDGSTTRFKDENEPQRPVEDLASIMANTGIFITKSAHMSRPQTSASVSISMHSGIHESLQLQTFTDADICQSLYDEARSTLDVNDSESFDSLPIDDIAARILQSASEFKSLELAIQYLRFSDSNSIPKHINTASFIAKTLDSASEEYGVTFVSHLMAYITFSRDPIQRCELLCLLTCDEEVILEARSKNYDLYSGSSSVRFPAYVLNSFLDNCILLQVMLPQRGDTMVCDCGLLIAAWCCSQPGFDHKFIHSNMAIYFLGVWNSDGFPTQPLEQVLPPAPDSINFRRIREGPYHAILAGELTLAAQEVARYKYIETCYRHGQGHEAAYYLKLLAGYIHSDLSKFSDTDLPKRVNDYWIFVHCNHPKLCLNVLLLSTLACSTSASSKIFEDAVANARNDIQWSNRTKGFRLPRNSSIDNMRCCRNLPNVQGNKCWHIL
jgi:ABC-type dipeptide/oligopeptide/nickel transport system ATPase subunit